MKIDWKKHLLPMKLKDGKRHVWPTLASLVYLNDGKTTLTDEQGLLHADKASDAETLGGKPASDYLLKTEGLQMELLWENDAPYSSIDPFEFKHDMSQFDYVRVLFNSHSSGETNITRAMIDVEVGSGTNGFFNCGITSSGKMWWAKRRVEVTTTGVQFYDGCYMYVDESVDGNQYAIPHKIYGVKGVKPLEEVSQ